jgi:hypothetical protein
MMTKDYLMSRVWKLALRCIEHLCLSYLAAILVLYSLAWETGGDYSPWLPFQSAGFWVAIAMLVGTECYRSRQPGYLREK